MTVRELKQGSVRLREEAFSRIRGAIISFADKPAAARASEWLLRFTLGALLGAARITGGASPFGAGFVCAAGAGAPGLFALIGAALGAVISSGFSASVKYVAISSLIYAASLIFRGTAAAAKRWVMPCIASVMAACTGLVYLLDSAAGADVAVYITDTALVGASARMYAEVLSPRGKSASKPALLFTLATVLITLSNVLVFDVLSIGRAAAVVIVISAAARGGSGAGAAMGAAFGFAMDIASASAPFFTAAYSLAAAAAGLCRNMPRAVIAVTYVIADAAAAMWSGSGTLLLSVLAETFAASVVFMLLPSGLLTAVREKVAGEDAMDGRERFIGYIRSGAEAAADAMKTVHESILRRLPDVNDDDVSCVFDMAACSVCEKCSAASRCWQSGYESTRTALNDATAAMLRRGALDEEDLPEYFRDGCGNVRGFVSAVNAELRSLRARRMYRKRLNEGRDARIEQYRSMEDMLRGIAGRLTERTDAEREAEQRLKLYLGGAGEQLHGGVFTDSNGRMHVELEGEGAGELRREKDYIERISAAVGVRLCENTERSTRGRVCFLEAEPLAASVGIAAMRREGQSVSGDTGTYFKTDEGVLCVILSDGMGSGERAAAESAEAASLLEGFLKSGVRPELAMKLLSSVMTLRGEETMGAATADLMCINLFSGSTGIYKFGAAPTYLYRGGKVKKISGESFSAGVGGFSAPDRTELTMKAGSVAVIVSDGVSADRDDEWLCRIISDSEWDSPRALARAIVEKAAVLHGASDDMTVLAVAISERR